MSCTRFAGRVWAWPSSPHPPLERPNGWYVRRIFGYIITWGASAYWIKMWGVPQDDFSMCGCRNWFHTFKDEEPERMHLRLKQTSSPSLSHDQRCYFTSLVVSQNNPTSICAWTPTSGCIYDYQKSIGFSAYQYVIWSCILFIHGPQFFWENIIQSSEEVKKKKERFFREIIMYPVGSYETWPTTLNISAHSGADRREVCWWGQ